MSVPLPVGLATSIGTLPHNDAAQAVRFVLEHQPRLPAVPSLPNRSPLERRIPQAAWGIPGVSVAGDASLVVEAARVRPGAPLEDREFRGDPFTTLRTFVAALAHWEGPAKFQLTGPLSLGVALSAAGMDGSIAFEVASSVVADRARYLLDYLYERAPGIHPVVFVDEPSLGALASPTFPLSPDEAIDLVSGVLAVLEAQAVTGLRCNGEADWHLVGGAGPQILALPATDAVLAQAGAIDRFLETGGWLAWGAVPTEGPVGSGVDRLWRALSGLWCQLVQAGVDPSRLRTQALITPIGGLGRHHVAQAADVLDLVGKLAKRLYDQATGLRLSVGA